MSASTIDARARASAWEGLRHRFAANRGMMVAIVIFAVMFALLRLHAAGRAQLERHQHGGQQGRAPRARGDGADAARADGRHRPVGRHDLSAYQLPGFQHRRWRSDHDDARRHRRAARRRCLRRAQRSDRRLRAPAADHRDDRDKRALLRSRADHPAAARRFDQSGARRPDDALDLLGAVVADHPAGAWWCSSGSPTGARSSAGQPTPSVRRNRRRTCRASPIGRAKLACLYAGRPALGDRRPVADGARPTPARRAPHWRPTTR